MQTIAKITPADYPDLLAAVDAGITQREPLAGVKVGHVPSSGVRG